MLVYLSDLTEWFSPLRVFRYVTFRALGGAATAFILSLALGPWTIRMLQKVRQPHRLEIVPSLDRTHGRKNVPTMGGFLILISVTVAAALWCVPASGLVWMTVGTMWVMGAVGFVDDFLKVTRKNPRGLAGRWKLLAQTACALVVVVVLWMSPDWHPLASQLSIPFLKHPVILDMGFVAAVLFASLVLVGCTNAVNLTDGLDGLAVGCTSSVSLAYLVMAYCTGHAVFAKYLHLPFVPGAGELAVVCGCLLGAGLGFLWWNCHPARIFMGDTGSLALGGAVGTIAMLINQELTLILVGGVFVMEAVSVMLQVAWFRISGGKRIFRCAPIHHHFEIVGKENAAREGRDTEVIETMVTTRLWIVSIIFALAGIASMKIR